MTTPSRLGLLITATALGLAACTATPPPGSARLGSVRVAVQGLPDGNNLFNAENRARVVVVDGTVVADWKLSADSPAPISVPVGSYTLSGYTVFFSDFLQCTDDASRAGMQSCFAPTLDPWPGQFCGVPIEVTETALIAALLTNVGQGQCRLELVPAPPDGVGLTVVPDRPT